MSFTSPFARFFLLAAAGFSAVEGLVQPRFVEVARHEHFRVVKPRAVQAPSPDVVTSHVLNLKRGVRRSRTSSAHLRSRAVVANATIANATGSTPLANVAGFEFVSELQFGQDTFQMVIDTGSSDLWVAKEGFQCFDVNQQPLNASACLFASTFNGSLSGGEIANQNFRLVFQDDEFVLGTLGFEDITMAGITVKGQEVALASSAHWNGDGITSGLLGLAFPELTKGFAGTDPNNDSSATQIEYNPLLFSMAKQGLIASPTFTLIQERNSTNGVLAFGGLPELDFVPEFTSTDVLFTLASTNPKARTELSFWTITPDSLVFQGPGAAQPTEDTTQFQAFVDSGTTLTFLPTDQANAILALYDPAPQLDNNLGSTTVPCNATAPSLSIKIGGKEIPISPEDLVSHAFDASLAPEQVGVVCVTGVQDGGPGPAGLFTLGDTFLNNVVAVFDAGASQMRFAPKP